MKRLSVGIIGLGEVAQIIHLPVLEDLAAYYTISAICDVSHDLLTHIGTRYHIPPEQRFTNYQDLVAQSDLDVVFVLNSDEYHADCTLAALKQHKHVLVEKPMCLTMSEANAIIQARQIAGVQVMVGYMRRYAPAFLEAVKRVHHHGHINYVRVRDIIGANKLIIEQSKTVRYVKDIPQEIKEDRQQRAQRLAEEAIGEHAAQFSGTYRLLCGLASHDLSALRELIGEPHRVLAATQSSNGNFLNVIFDYGDFHAMLELGIDGQRRFDAHVEVYYQTHSMRVQYDSPYIRHFPTTLHTCSTDGSQYQQEIIRPTLTDAYTCELLAFHNCVLQNSPPKTNPEDFTRDLILFQDIITFLAGKKRIRPLTSPIEHLPKYLRRQI